MTRRPAALRALAALALMGLVAPRAAGHLHAKPLGRYRGTMKAGGATLDAPFCHVFRFHGGKIVTFQQYTDTARWAQLMA